MNVFTVLNAGLFHQLRNSSRSKANDWKMHYDMLPNTSYSWALVFKGHELWVATFTFQDMIHNLSLQRVRCFNSVVESENCSDKQKHLFFSPHKTKHTQLTPANVRDYTTARSTDYSLADDVLSCNIYLIENLSTDQKSIKCGILWDWKSESYKNSSYTHKMWTSTTLMKICQLFSNNLCQKGFCI